MSTDAPPRVHRLLAHADTGKSAIAAIRAHCLMCMGWDARAVAACTNTSCPLHKYRDRQPDYRCGKHPCDTDESSAESTQAA